MKTNNIILRILTATVFISLFIIVWMVFPVQGMFLLVSALTAGLIWEYYKLIFYEKLSLRCHLFFSLFGFFSYLVFFLMEKWDDVFLLVIYLFLFCSFWILYLQEGKQAIQKTGLSFIGLFYISLPAALFLKMFSHSDRSSDFLLFFLCVIFSGDIFAYIGGRMSGGKKWVPAVSPNKTWVGLFCGLLAGGMVSGAGAFYLKEQMSVSLFSLFFLLGALSFLIAQTGDLFVSFLKRQAGVKDSGSLLPGHGGLLDRLDGFLMAFPFACVLFNLSI